MNILFIKVLHILRQFCCPRTLHLELPVSRWGSATVLEHKAHVTPQEMMHDLHVGRATFDARHHKIKDSRCQCMRILHPLELCTKLQVIDQNAQSGPGSTRSGSVSNISNSRQIISFYDESRQLHLKKHFIALLSASTRYNSTCSLRHSPLHSSKSLSSRTCYQGYVRT